MTRSLTINESDLRAIARAREGLLGSLDAKRPAAWDQFGYPEHLTFDRLLMAYERGGPGHGAVHRILDKCWQERPRIKQPEADKETPWETKLGKLLSSVNGWQKLRDLDRRNMIGRFAGLIYRVADSRKLDEPLERAARLVDLVPVYESQLRVEAWEQDPNSENFGAVTMWEYRFQPPHLKSTDAPPDRWVRVHPSRVQILAEGAVGNFQDGVPLLKAGFNHLVDLEKIGGGSAESFLKNSARAITFEFAADASPQVITQNPDGSSSGRTVREVVEEQVDGLNRNLDSAIVTQGAKAGVLNTHQSDPEPAFNVAANLFAASVQVPMTILFGAQTGRLASDQDKEDMIARCKSRQINELTPMLEQLVRRLQAAGLVDAAEFEVEWPDLGAPSDDDKVGLAEKMERINKSAADSSRAPIFEADEVRKAAGYEPLTDAGMPVEGDPAADPNAPPADPAMPPGA